IMRLPVRLVRGSAPTLGSTVDMRQANVSHGSHAKPAWEAPMEIIWLRVFREVARQGSFTAAADALRYTQSAVSRQIAALESDTGATLFDRVPRGVRLTDEGRCLLEHADAVLGRLDSARRDLAALRDLDGGRLRIGAFA